MDKVVFGVIVILIAGHRCGPSSKQAMQERDKSSVLTMTSREDTIRTMYGKNIRKN